MSKEKTPQKYFVPELGIHIKVDHLSTNIYVAHYPTGPERVKELDIKAGKWTHQGKWEDDTHQGVQIQKLPTVGKPLSMKGTRYRPSGLDVIVPKSEVKKINQIKKALADD